MVVAGVNVMLGTDGRGLEHSGLSGDFLVASLILDSFAIYGPVAANLLQGQDWSGTQAKWIGSGKKMYDWAPEDVDNKNYKLTQDNLNIILSGTGQFLEWVRQPDAENDLRKVGSTLYEASTEPPAYETANSYFSLLGRLWMGLLSQEEKFWTDCAKAAAQHNVKYEAPTGNAKGRCISKLLENADTNFKVPRNSGLLRIAVPSLLTDRTRV
jgi:hypothetical protein